MAGEIASAFVRIRPDMTGFRGEVEGKFRSAFAGVGKIVGGALAIGGAFELGKGVVEAAASHQAAFAVLDRAIKNANASTNVYGATIEKVLEKEARLKGFSDEGLAQSFLRLVSATHDSTKAFKDLQAAEDLSRARGIDLATAALAISKAEQGKATSLQRYGIVLPKVTTAEDALVKKRQEALAQGAKLDSADNARYAAALKIAKAQDAQAASTGALALVTQRFGGAAQTFAETASGQFERLRQDFHQFEVAIGTQFLGGLASAAEGIGTFVTHLTQNESLMRGVHGVVSDLGTAFHDLKAAIEVVGPTLVSVASAAASVVHAIGAPAILAAVATYKGLAIATSAAAAAQAFYARAVAASVGPEQAAATAESRKAAATGETAAATTALTGALVANTAALTANAEAAAVATRGYFALSAESVAVTETASAATAANAGLAASETAVGAAGTTASAGGLGAFTRGIGALGLRGVGGVGGIAVAGLAALAGTFVYLGKRADATTQAFHRFESGLGALGAALQSLPIDRLAVQQANLNLEVANNALATTKAKQGSAEYTQLVLNQKQAVISLEAAQHQLNTTTGASAAAVRKERDGLVDLIAAQDKTYQFQIKSLGTFPKGSPGFAKQQALEAQAATLEVSKLVEKLREDADAQRAQSPLLAHNLDLLAQYAAAVKHVPTKHTIAFFLENADANITLKRLLAAMERQAQEGGRVAGGVWWNAFSNSLTELSAVPSGIWPGLTAGIQAAAAKAEQDVKQGAAARKISAAAKAAMKTLRDGLSLDASSLTELRQQIALQAQTGAESILQAITSAQSNFSAIGQTIATDIQDVVAQPLVLAQQQLALQGDRLALAFDQQSTMLQARATVYDQALQAIQFQQQSRAAQFAGQNAQIQQESNRIGLRSDQLNLQQLRRSVILPGGKTLSSNSKDALAQLQDFANKSRGASRLAIEQFIDQYRSAILSVEKDKIGIATQQNPKQAQRQADLQVAQSRNQIDTAILAAKHASAQAQQQLRGDIIRIGVDVSEARARVAAKEIADLTDAFNRAPSPAALKRVTKKIANIMASDHVSFADAGRLLGSAFVHGFQAQFAGLGQQGQALFNVKVPAGGGLVPAITHPLQTITQQNIQAANLTKQFRRTQLDEAKKQTKLLQVIAGQRAAQKLLTSLDKNPGGASKRSKTLAGTTG